MVNKRDGTALLRDQTILEFFFFHIRTVHLDFIKVLFIHQLMHK